MTWEKQREQTLTRHSTTHLLTILPIHFTLFSYLLFFTSIYSIFFIPFFPFLLTTYTFSFTLLYYFHHTSPITFITFSIHFNLHFFNTPTLQQLSNYQTSVNNYTLQHNASFNFFTTYDSQSNYQLFTLAIFYSARTLTQHIDNSTYDKHDA